VLSGFKHWVISYVLLWVWSYYCLSSSCVRILLIYFCYHHVRQQTDHHFHSTETDALVVHSDTVYACCCCSLLALYSAFDSVSHPNTIVNTSIQNRSYSSILTMFNQSNVVSLLYCLLFLSCAVYHYHRVLILSSLAIIWVPLYLWSSGCYALPFNEHSLVGLVLDLVDWPLSFTAATLSVGPYDP